MLAKPYWQCLIAEGCGSAGRIDEGLAVLADAESTVASSSERYWEAEIHRVRGDLLSASADVAPSYPTPEACYQRALDIARKRKARSLELRAVLALARLWQRDGRTEEALHLVRTTRGSFDEGLTTADVTTADALFVRLRHADSPATSGCGRRIGRVDRNSQVGWTDGQWNRVREEILREWQRVRVAG